MSLAFVRRDLKCENCLLTGGLIVKICDFGLARILSDVAETKPKPKSAPKRLGNLPMNARLSIAGTDEWMAPEVIIGTPYNKSADVFSLGIVLYEIVVRKKPEQRVAQRFFEFSVEEFQKMLPNECPQVMVELCIQCSKLDPKERPKVSQVTEKLTSFLENRTEMATKSPRNRRSSAPVGKDSEEQEVKEDNNDEEERKESKKKLVQPRRSLSTKSVASHEKF